MENNTFIELLQTSKLIPSEVLESLIQNYGNGPLEMLEEIIDQKLLSKDKACEFWSKSINVAYVNPCQTLVKKEICNILPESFARQNKALALYRFGDVVTVSMSTPLDLKLLNELEQMMGMTISPVFSLPEEIDAAISINYQTKINIEQYIEEKSLTDERSYFLGKEIIIVWTMLNRWTWRDRNIRINAVSPGPVDTPVLGDFLSTLGERAEEDMALMGHAGSAKNIANVICFLASEQSDWIRGTNIPCDGGMSSHVMSKINNF